MRTRYIVGGALALLFAAPAVAGTCKVTLSKTGGAKLNVVKVVKSLTGLGLKEAKALVDAAPGVVLSGASKAQASAAVQSLKDAGASASSSCGAPAPPKAASVTGACKVHLSKVGGAKLNVVKAVKSLTGLGLKEAKQRVDASPEPVFGGSKSQAQAAVTALRDAGATPVNSCGGSAPPKKVTGACKVHLSKIGGAKLNVVKVVKSLTGLGLKEAKEAVEASPKPLFAGSKSKAAKAAERLTDAGATAHNSCAAAGDTATGPTVPGKGPCVVRLTKAGGAKLNVVKVVKAHTGLGLKASKALVDAAPGPVFRGNASKTQALAVSLRDAGASASKSCK